MACLEESVFSAYFSRRLGPRDTDELFAHVDSCASCAGRFAASADTQSRAERLVADDITVSAAEPAADAPVLIGTLGRYQLERVLGMGGMGVVYAAHDPQLNRRVAIKLLRPERGASGEVLRARLMREAQAMAQLSHPNVVHVHEVGSAGEQLFVVMELVAGTTLKAWLQARPRPWREIVQAFLAAAAGLEAAHRAGIVHRDFKPDNVLVASDGRICVTDFGLARQRDELGGESAASPSAFLSPTTITAVGAIIGTPAYMAPEQLRGEPADARSDIFSFCVALYEALTGARPFAGRTVGELRSAVEKGELAPGTERVPRWLLRAVVKGLAAAPADRHASLAELATALRADPAPRRRRILVGVAVTAAIALTVVGYEQLARRSRACVGAEQQLAGIWDVPRKQLLRAAFVAHGPPGATALWNGVAAELDAYARDWTAVHTNACVATRLTGEQSEELLDLRMQCLHDRVVELRALTDLLGTADAAMIANAATAARGLSSLADCSNTEALRAGTRLPSDATLRTQIDAELMRLGRARALFLGASAAQALDLAGDVARSPAAARHAPLRAQALALRGMALTMLGRFDEGEPVLKEAGRLALSCRADRVAVESWLALANLNGQRRRLDAALEWSTMAEALLARAGDSKQELKRLHTLAEVYRLNGRPKEEVEVARRALALAEKLSPPDDLELGISLYDLGAALSTNGESPVEAEALERRALAAYARHPDEYQREQDRALTGLGVILTTQHRYVEAAEIARQALALDEQLFPPGHPWLAYSLLNLCDNLAKLDRFDEAAQALERATPIVREHALADLQPQLPILRAIVDAGRGRDDASVTAPLESALAMPALGGADRAEVQMALARASWQRRDHRRALALAGQARALLEKDTPRDDATIARIAGWMAKHGP